MAISPFKRKDVKVEPYDPKVLDVETMLRNAPGRPRDLDQLEPELGEVDYRPPAARTLPLPDYVDHDPEVEREGRLSSESLVLQYEAAAKNIESLRSELTLAAQGLHRGLEEIYSAIKWVDETAQLYREEGKLLFERVEQASKVATKVREICDAGRAQIKK